MSAAEKQRRYRARRDADPLRRQQYLEKEKEKWKKDIATGIKLLQKDRTSRGQRAQRKKWKEWHERSKARKKVPEGLSTLLLSPESPPEIPLSSQESSSSSQPFSSRLGYNKRIEEKLVSVCLATCKMVKER